jgi:hypothetical protein
MSNVIKHEPASFQDIMSIGKAFAESGMFADIKSAAQAVVKIQAGQELGIAPFAAMSGIHIIQGKPAVGAGIMAAKVKASGKYDYEVIKMDEKICSLDFLQGKKKLGNSTFTIEDAKKANTKNLDKFPKNMLFARAMSNGVRWFTPDIFTSPVYTPEEMQNVTEDIPHEDVTPPATSPSMAPQKQMISGKAFNQAIARIGLGEHELVDKLKETYELTEEQVKKIEAAATPVENEPA